MDSKKIYSFYENHLKEALLPFWLKNSPDRGRGGFFTCFDNITGKLISRDKYTWSQGRMVWVMSKLSTVDCFDGAERAEFLSLARSGAEFIRDRVILGGYRCTFLTDGEGNPKPVSGDGILDSSISADGFAAMGLARYAAVSGDGEFYALSRNIYDSIVKRIDSGNYRTLPYPEIPGFPTHGTCMGQLDLSMEIASMTEAFGDGRHRKTAERAGFYANEILSRFRDGNNLIRETISDNGIGDGNILTRHIKPGHAIECMWFIIHYALKHDRPDMIKTACEVILASFGNGWDVEYGGLFLFTDCDGGEPKGSVSGIENEEMTRKVRTDWSGKVWWVHSETLYALLLGYKMTGNEEFLEFYEMLHGYTFRTFPNPDVTVGEWLQIRNRRGEPETRVVALPVKDPYHIIRNMILIMELMEK